MRLPRDISGAQLVRSLKAYGYEVSRQTGSHIRVSTVENGTHHITIPNHDPIKLGTLASILDDIAVHFQCSRNEVLLELKL